MKTIFIILFNVSVVIIQVTSLILAIVSGELLKSNIIYLSNLLDNWSATPIKDIKLFDFHCPFNYEPLFVNKYAISCDFNLDRDFLDLKAANTPIFKNENNQTVCVERYGEFFYFQIKQKTLCNNTLERDCGILDTLGNRYCVSKNQTCPINGIAIKHHQENMSSSSHHIYGKIDREQTNGSLYQYLQINKDYSLVTSNNHKDDSAYLAVDIDIIADKASRNLNCRHYSHSKRTKPHNRMKGKSDSENEIESLDKSDVINFHNHKIDIEYRPYIGWKQSCLHNKHSTPNNVEKLYEKYKMLFDSKQKVNIFYIIFTLTIMFILIYFFSLHLDLKVDSHYNYLILSQVIFGLCLIPLLYSDISIYLSVLNDPNSVDTFNCSDDSNNSKLRQIKHNLHYNNVFDCSLFALLGVNLVFSVLFVVCLYRSDNRESQSNN